MHCKIVKSQDVIIVIKLSVGCHGYTSAYGVTWFVIIGVPLLAEYHGYALSMENGRIYCLVSVYYSESWNIKTS